MAKKGGKSAISRFIGSRTTVTALGLVVCVATLIIGYNWRVNKSIDVTTVPYAKTAITAKTLITSDMVGKINISSSYVSGASNLITQSDQVINKYATYKANIPKGSLFYKDYIVEADEMPDAAFANIKDGYTIFNLGVDEETTIGNSIRAGDYIDLYISATDDDNDGKIIFTKFISSIEVLAVKDEAGKNILKNGTDNGKPYELLFAVSEEYFLLLREAENVPDGEIEIIPVLRNSEYSRQKNEIEVNNAEVRAFIEDQVSTMYGYEKKEA